MFNSQYHVYSLGRECLVETLRNDAARMTRIDNRATKINATMRQNSDTVMERVLWYLFAGTRGGENRAKIVQSLTEQPQNPNQLANNIGVDYNTIQYHLEKLEENRVVEQEQKGYGALYFITAQFEENKEEFRNILQSESILDKEWDIMQQEGVGR